MADEIAVLGVATSSARGALTVHRVIVRVAEDDAVVVEPLKAWQGAPNDETRSIGDLVDALGNILDPKRRGSPEALALKRAESTRGRPTKQYDQKTRAEAAAMIAALGQGRRYFQYRTNQLGPGRDLNDVACEHSGYPSTKEGQEAVAAACAAVADLRGEG
jgi:hypothetical protein